MNRRISAEGKMDFFWGLIIGAAIGWAFCALLTNKKG